MNTQDNIIKRKTILSKRTLGIQLKNIQYRTLFTFTNILNKRLTIISKCILSNIIIRNMGKLTDTVKKVGETLSHMKPPVHTSTNLSSTPTTTESTNTTNEPKAEESKADAAKADTSKLHPIGPHDYQSTGDKVSHLPTGEIQRPCSWFNSSSTSTANPNENSTSSSNISPTSTPTESAPTSSESTSSSSSSSTITALPTSQDTVPSESNKITRFVKEGIVEYKAKGETQLTEEGREIYRYKQQKCRLREDSSSADESFKDLDQEQGKTLVAGIVKVNQEETEILTPVQSHVVVGELDPKDSSVTTFVLLTSEKGTKAGIAGISTTTKLSDKQPFSGKEQGQYARPISPPLVVKEEDFEEHEQGTDYVNLPDIAVKVYGIKTNTDRFEPVAYDTVGITMDDLEEISRIKAEMEMTSKEEEEKNKHEEVA